LHLVLLLILFCRSAATTHPLSLTAVSCSRLLCQGQETVCRCPFPSPHTRFASIKNHCVARLWAEVERIVAGLPVQHACGAAVAADVCWLPPKWFRCNPAHIALPWRLLLVGHNVLACSPGCSASLRLGQADNAAHVFLAGCAHHLPQSSEQEHTCTTCS
jgi:hypothetical protein